MVLFYFPEHHTGSEGRTSPPPLHSCFHKWRTYSTEHNIYATLGTQPTRSSRQKTVLQMEDLLHRTAHPAERRGGQPPRPFLRQFNKWRTYSTRRTPLPKGGAANHLAHPFAERSHRGPTLLTHFMTHVCSLGGLRDGSSIPPPLQQRKPTHDLSSKAGHSLPTSRTT